MPKRAEILVGDAAAHVAPAALAEWTARQPARQRARLWLAGELTQELMAPTDLQHARGNAWPDYARRVAAHYGMPAAGPLASWRSRQAAGASLCVDSLEAATLRRAAPRGAHPLWLGGLALARSRLGADSELWVVESTLATRISLRRGELLRVERLWLAADEGEDGLRARAGSALVVGERLAGTPAEAPLRFAGAQQWATALASLPALSAPDLSQVAPTSAGGIGWALAATGILVLSVAGWDAAVARQSIATQAQALTPRAMASSTARPGARRDTGDAATLQRMRSLLIHPWGAAFAPVDALAPRGGRWLSLDHRAGDTRLRLEGVAGDMEAALDAVRRLSTLPEVASAQLLRAEQRPEGGLHVELRVQVRGVSP